MTEKIAVRGANVSELENLVAELGEPRYRGRQLFRALHARRAMDVHDISELPKEFRERVAAVAEPALLQSKSKYTSADGTRRFLLETSDGLPVESVFIPTEGRDTICFSSQSGCPLKCDFCLTAKLGLLRNLSAAEIVEQVAVVLNDVYGAGARTPHGTNLVAMGAGEPFLNFENLIKAIEVMGDSRGMFIVPGRVTVSTAGVVPKIRAFAGLERRPNLAISLTAPTDELRDRLMPINRRWNIDELMSAAKHFEKTLRRGERFTFEYVLLGGVNDSDEQAAALSGLLDRYNLRKVKVNLIPHNPAEQLDYFPSPPERVEAFKRQLESRGVSAYVRRARGSDIFAACGQLAAKDEPNLVSITANRRAA